jgi:valyl-tRNA synthetase
VRSERTVSPKTEVEVTIRCDERDRGFLERHNTIITRLAGVKTLHLSGDTGRIPASATKIAANCEVIIHDVIDDGAEKARLTELLGKVDREIAFSRKKLENPQFTGKAPPHIVAGQKEKLEEHLANRETILASLAALDRK